MMKVFGLYPRSVVFVIMFVVLAFPGAAKAVAEPVPQAAVPAGLALPGAPVLELRQVTLFSSGVGHFTHSGTVDAGDPFTITVSVEHLDDLLKTLTLESVSGGTIRTVDYFTGDPLDRALTTLPVQPGGGLLELLSGMIGEQLAVGTPPIAGRLVAVERVGDAGANGDHRTIRLTLLTADGLRTAIPGDETRILVDDPVLRGRIDDALNLIRATRTIRDRTLTVRTAGDGPQELRASYVREMPVWKPTYRLVLDSGVSHLLQAWAIVENTTSTDWVNISLTLVAGDPVSFRMPLAEPIYQRRPSVPFPLAQLTRPSQFADALPPSPSMMSRSAPAAAAMRGEQIAMEADFGFQGRGVESAADTAAQGVFHRYVVRDPVSIPAGGAAMVPIVQQRIPAEMISVYDPAVNAAVPVAGVQMTNTTGAALSAGPITVFDRGAYAGEAVLQYLGEQGERLLSFSLDRRTEVSRRVDSVPERITSVRISRGVMTTTSELRRDHRYTVASRDAAPRVLLIQHRREGDWRLVSPVDFDQEYADGYRFRMPLSAVETRQLVVTEQRARSESITLTNITGDRIAVFLSQREIPAEVRNALVRIRTLQSDLAAAQAEVRGVEQRMADIEREQQRIRSNMAVLAQNSDLYRRYVADLTGQEDRLIDLRAERQTARDTEERARLALERFIAQLTVN